MPVTELTSPEKAKTELRDNWGISDKTINELQNIVGKATYQDLVLDRLRQDKIEDLYVILVRLAERAPREDPLALPVDRPVLLPMMDVLTRILALDNYLEKLLATGSFTSKEHTEDGVANPGRARLKEYDVVLNCLGIRDFTRIVEWIAFSANKKVDHIDVCETMSVLKDSLLKSGQIDANDENKKKLTDIAKRLKENSGKPGTKWPNLRSLIDSRATRTKAAIDVVDQLIFCNRNLAPAKQPIPTHISSLASVLYRDSRYEVLKSQKENHTWVGDALGFLKNEQNGEYSQFAELVDLGSAALEHSNPSPIALSSDVWLLGCLYEKLDGEELLSIGDDPYNKILKSAKKKQLQPGQFVLKLTLNKGEGKCSVDIVPCTECVNNVADPAERLILFVYPIKYKEIHQKHDFVIKVESQEKKSSDQKHDDPLMAGDVIIINGDRSKEYFFYGFDSTGRVIAIDMVGKYPTFTFLQSDDIRKLVQHDPSKDPAMPLAGLNKRIREKRAVEYTTGQLPTSVSYELHKLAEGEVQGKKVKDYISSIEGNGFRSYIVGGGVRDTLLKREVNDVDLATLMPAIHVYHKLLKEKLCEKKSPFGGSSDKSEELPPIKKNIPMGIVKVDPQNPKGIDIVTFHDSMNKPGSSVGSGSGFIYDTLSRDFTFNAIYYDCSERKLIDATGCGLEDLGYDVDRPTKNLNLKITGIGKHIEVRLRFVCCALTQVWEENTEDTVSAKYKDALSRHLTNFPVDMARWIKFLSKNDSGNMLRYIPYSRKDVYEIEKCLEKLASKTDDKSKYNKKRFITRMGCSTTAALKVFDNADNFFSSTELKTKEINATVRQQLIGDSLTSIQESLRIIFGMKPIKS